MTSIFDYLSFFFILFFFSFFYFFLLFYFVFFFFFFFSSRRRHTRWNCDWSSDVCSSDLLHLLDLSVGRHARGVIHALLVLGLLLLGLHRERLALLQQHVLHVLQIGRASCRERV